MKNLYTLLGASLLSVTLFAQNSITVNASDNWITYVNVFDLGGGYQWGSFWDVSKAKTTVDVSNNTVILQPNFNTYEENQTDPYWVDQTTKAGNKIMEVSTFVEPGPSFNDNDLTFEGDVLEYTLNETDYEVFFFIKAIDSLNNYSDALGGSKVMPMPKSGHFSVDVTASEIPSGLIVQYGFTVKGVNANPAEEANLGAVKLGTDDASIDNIEKIQASIYPNPANTVLNISTEDNFQTYKVKNLAGQEICSGNTNLIDLSSINNGLYFVEIETNRGACVKSFVKK